MLEIQEIFSPTSSVKSNNFADLLPASFRDDDLSIHTPLHDITKFLHLDLSVQRLNDIQEHLWLAGRPMPPRPLNYQISVSRQIIIDEKIDMHLIWGPGRRIHIKPLPQYLLDSQFCDFRIAQEHSLVPDPLTWPQWRALVQSMLSSDITNPTRINNRYVYGELRLSRLNKIYAFQRGSFFRGYRAKYQTYKELFHTYLAPITAMRVYFALVLTAMQVGLATEPVGW
ncbi:hypothetical protein N7475_007419 [Penicillium sp. IBT 31633x]|nr:hypothetical protein N7475_007419 [Penicillium sp. IBT 31633x]